MRLWNTLQKVCRDTLEGLRSAGSKRVRRAERPRTRLEVEALDQRLLPSTVPNLGGVTMAFGPAPAEVYAPRTLWRSVRCRIRGAGRGLSSPSTTTAAMAY
jgi:hypothetical protein